jgi:hypothetical protein
VSTSARPSFAPWDERDLPRSISAEDASRRARIFAEIERRLARLLEEVAANESGHGKATITRHARHHAWHAELWDGKLSDATEPGVEGDVDAELTAFLDAVEDPKLPDQLIEVLTGIYRVLIPRKIAAYTYYYRALGSSATDSDARWLDFILKDEFDGVRDGELLLQSLLKSEEDVQRSAAARAKLEGMLVRSGGIAGPGTLGAPAQEVTTS